MYLPKRKENACPQKHSQTNVHRSFIHYHPKLETTRMSASRHAKTFMAYSYSRIPHYQRRGEAPNAQSGELMSGCRVVGNEATGENVVRTLCTCRSRSFFIFKTASLHDQASLELTVWLRMALPHFIYLPSAPGCLDNAGDWVQGSLVHASKQYQRSHTFWIYSALPQ